MKLHFSKMQINLLLHSVCTIFAFQNQVDYEKESQVIFDRNVVEFVTVAAEFCKFLEQAETMKRDTFVDTSLKILPLLYLKAAMLPETEIIGDEAPESYVTEETYEVLRINLAGILAERMIIWMYSYKIWFIATNPSRRIFPKTWRIFTRPSKISFSSSNWD